MEKKLIYKHDFVEGCIADIARDLAETRVLSLSNGSVSDEIVTRICTALCGSTTILEELHLVNVGVTAAQVCNLAKALCKNCTVEVLEVSNTYLGDDVMAPIADMLTQNSTISDLRLQHVGMTSPGAIALARGIARRTAVLYLDLDHNDIDSEGALALARLIESRPTLSTGTSGLPRTTCLEGLCLEFNKIGDDGACALACALQRMPAHSPMRSLLIMSCGVSNKGMLEFAHFLYNSPKSFRLWLGGADEISLEAENAFVRAIRHNPLIVEFWANNRQNQNPYYKALEENRKRPDGKATYSFNKFTS